MFSRAASVWSQQGAGLTPIDASPPFRQSRGMEEGFGYAVAISGDASTVLIGDPSEAEGVGAAWAFARAGTTWEQQGPKLTGGGELGEGSFGYSVTLSSDGNTALIGAPYDDNQPTTSENVRQGTSGATWAFRRSAGTWSQQGAKLTVKDREHQTDLGLAVALSGDGETALIGASESAWAFASNSSGWSQQGPALSDGAPFGERLSLSGDGNTALIGGISANDCGKYMYDPCGTSGSVWTYRRSGTTWAHQATLRGRRQFGSSVAISADGTTALLGSPLENNSINSIEGGAVLVSALPPPATG